MNQDRGFHCCENIWAKLRQMDSEDHIQLIYYFDVPVPLVTLQNILKRTVSIYDYNRISTSHIDDNTTRIHCANSEIIHRDYWHVMVAIRGFVGE